MSTRKNNGEVNPLTSSNDFSHSTNNDPFATIEFTEEDLKKLRRPNPQPLDSDYFARENQLTASEWETEVNEQVMISERDQEKSVETSEPSVRTWARNYRRNETDHLAEHTHQRWNQDNNEESEIITDIEEPVYKNAVTETESQDQQFSSELKDLSLHPDIKNQVSSYDEQTATEQESLDQASQEDLEEIQEDVDSQLENLDLDPASSDILSVDLPSMSEDPRETTESEYVNFDDVQVDDLDLESVDTAQEDAHQEQIELRLPEVEEGENPFAYRSIEPKLRAEQKMNRSANVKPSFFQNLFQTLFISRSERLEESEQEELLEQPLEDHYPVESQETEDLEIVDSDPLITSDRLTEVFSEEVVVEDDQTEVVDEVRGNTEDSVTNEPLETINLEPRVVYHDSFSEEEAMVSSDIEGDLVHIEEDSALNLEEVQVSEDSRSDLQEDIVEEYAIAIDSDSELVEEDKETTETIESVEPIDTIDLDELALYEETYEDLSWDRPGSSQEAERAIVQALAHENYSDEYEDYEQTLTDEPAQEISPTDKAKESLQSGLNKVKLGWGRLVNKAKTTFNKQERNQEFEIDENVKVSEPESAVDSNAVDLTPDAQVMDGETITLADRVSQQTAQYNEPILTDAIIEAAMAKGHLETPDEEATYIEIPEPEEKVSSRQFVSGAAWLSAGKIFSRVIGALYVIPWATWLGAEYTQANTLISVGYKPYSLFLAIATAGFPSAVAKQMAYFNTKKEFKLADKLFKYSLLIMVLTGILSAAGMFFLAPILAEQSATDNPEAAIIVIRSLAPALLILPVMSLLRGYFQGFNDMVPTAISEVLEQIARVIYMLVATYSIMMVYSGNVTDAVAHSTFAAFVGALASLLYLLVVYLRYLPMIRQLKRESANEMDIDFWQSLKLMLLDSIPFILLGSGIILLQMIDVYTFKQILVRTSVLLSPEISVLFGAMSHDVDKLIMIIISIAVAIATSSIPAVTAKFAEGDRNKTGELVKDIVLTFAFVMIPASIGMASVANNLYPFFYPAGYEMGPDLLVTGTFMSISLGAYTIFSAILQSMNYRRQAVRYLIVGLVVKIVLQFPMVGFFQAHGAMLATTFAFTVSSIMMWMKIWHAIKIHDRYFAGDLIRICLATIVMGITCSGWNNYLNLAFGPVGRGLTFVKIMLVAIVGIFIYLAIMGLFGMLNILIGNYRSDLQERMSIH